MGRNTVAIRTRAPLPYLLVTVKVIALEKPFLVIYKIVRRFVNTLNADGKGYLLNGENLMQPNHMQ